MVVVPTGGHRKRKMTVYPLIKSIILQNWNSNNFFSLFLFFVSFTHAKCYQICFIFSLCILFISFLTWECILQNMTFSCLFKFNCSNVLCRTKLHLSQWHSSIYKTTTFLSHWWWQEWSIWGKYYPTCPWTSFYLSTAVWNRDSTVSVLSRLFLWLVSLLKLWIFERGHLVTVTRQV